MDSESIAMRGGGFTTERSRARLRPALRSGGWSQRRRRRPIVAGLALAFALLVSLAFTGSALAAEITWDGGGADGKWSTAANWDGDSVPQAGDDVIMTGEVRQSNTYDLSITLNSITFQGPGWSVSPYDGSTVAKLNVSSESGYSFVVSDGATVSWAVDTQAMGADPDPLWIVVGLSQYATSATSLSFSGDLNTSNASSDPVQVIIETYGSSTASITGSISGDGWIEKWGASTLTLQSGSGNTYTGGTIVSEGTLRAVSNGDLPDYDIGSVGVDPGATLAVLVGTEWTSSDVDTLLANVGWSTGAYFGFDTTNVSGGTFTYASDISMSGKGLKKLGTGTLVLSGTNVFGGTTNNVGLEVLEGTVEATTRNALYRYNNARPRKYVFAGARLVVDAGGSGWTAAEIATYLNYANTGGFWLATTATFGIDTTGGTITSTGADLKGGMMLEKLGSNTLEIQTSSAIYTGGTKITSGTIKLLVNDALPTEGNVLLSQSASSALDVNGYTQTIGAISGGADSAGVGTVSLGSGSLTSSFSSGSYTCAGRITGSGSFARDGSGGTLTITGTNEYTGMTSCLGGILRINNEVRLGANPSSFDADHLYFDGGTLEAYGTFTIDDSNRGVTLDAGHGTIDVDSGCTLTLAEVVTGTGNLTKTDPGTLVLSGTNTYTGRTIIQRIYDDSPLVQDWISGGTVQISSHTGLGADPGSTVADSLTIDGGTLEATGNAGLVAQRGVTLGNGGGTFDVNSGVTVTVNGVVANVSGHTGFLNKTDTGELVLNATNTYTGATNVTAGTLRVNGSLDDDSAVTIASGATLAGTGNVAGTVALSGTIAPGNAGSVGELNSGSETWNGGANYPVHITDAVSGAGTGWDLVDITGNLTIAATSESKFAITLSGTAANFSSTGGYRWPIARVTGDITGFDLTKLSFDHSGFTNDLDGRFMRLELAPDGSSIDIVLRDPTAASIGSFEAYLDGGQVFAWWDTAGQVGTLGFNVYRQNPVDGQWLRVNETLIPALFESPGGGTFALLDPGAPTSGPVTYKLEEIELWGSIRMHGPYEVTVSPAAKRVEADVTADGSTQKETLRQVVLAAELPRIPLKSPLAAAGRPTDRIRIEVVTSGVYAIRAADISTMLGLAPVSVRVLIRNGGLALTNQGRPVATMAAPDNSAIYFFGESLVSPYSATNVYFLGMGKGATMKKASLPNGGTPATTFTEHLHMEEDLLPITALFRDPESDFWLWGSLVAGSAQFGTKTFTLIAPDVVSGQRLNVALLGLSDTGTVGEHHVRVSLNGVVLGDASFSGITAETAGFDIPAGVLVSGENQVTVQALADSGAPYGSVGVDAFGLIYTRSAVAINDQLQLATAAAGTMQVGGLSGTTAWAFDVTDPRNPRVVAGKTGGTAGAAWIKFGTVADGRYVVAGSSGVLQPLSLTSVALSTLGSYSKGADYVVICAPALGSAASALADYRAGQGMRTAVVTTQEIYDAYSHGIATPKAINSFLAMAAKRWKPAPSFVVLAGEGSFDYRNNLGKSDCMVPSMLVGSPYGLVPSDALLADLNGDSVADVALGRIPAQTVDEFLAYAAKVERYEASTGEWRSNVLFSADNPDNGGDFDVDSDALANLVPGSYTVGKAYLGALSFTDARAALLDAFRNGSLLVNYVGHAGVDRLANEKLLALGDVASLTAAGREPLLVAMTCNVGNFAIPGLDGLSETLTLKGDGGAIAVFAPTSMEMNDDSAMLDSKLLPAVFSGEHANVGAAIRAALGAYGADGGKSSVLASYTLLGDPALLVVQ